MLPTLLRSKVAQHAKHWALTVRLRGWLTRLGRRLVCAGDDELCAELYTVGILGLLKLWESSCWCSSN